MSSARVPGAYTSSCTASLSLLRIFFTTSSPFSLIWKHVTGWYSLELIFKPLMSSSSRRKSMSDRPSCDRLKYFRRMSTSSDMGA